MEPQDSHQEIPHEEGQEKPKSGKGAGRGAHNKGKKWGVRAEAVPSVGGSSLGQEGVSAGEVGTDAGKASQAALEAPDGEDVAQEGDRGLAGQPEPLGPLLSDPLEAMRWAGSQAWQKGERGLIPAYRRMLRDKPGLFAEKLTELEIAYRGREKQAGEKAGPDLNEIRVEELIERLLGELGAP